MKKFFRGYFRPTEPEFDQLWDEAIFTFDASFLLNVYRYTPATQQKMLSILEKLGDRVWIPHQAALEFHRNRHRVIATQSAAYDHVKKAVVDALSNLQGQISKFARHPFIDCSSIGTVLAEARDRVIEQLEVGRTNHPNLNEVDSLRDRLAEILSDETIGNPFSPEIHKDLRAEGERRYKQKIPPGFKDDDDDAEHPYGDFYVWRQLKERASAIQRPVVFTTDDRKEDWWLRLHGKTIGPRPELIQEMLESTGQMFYMYVSDSFIEVAGRRFGIEGSEEAVREVRTIHEQDERQKTTTTAQAAPGVDPNLVLGMPGRQIARPLSSVSDVRTLRTASVEPVSSDESTSVRPSGAEDDETE